MLLFPLVFLYPCLPLFSNECFYLLVSLSVFFPLQLRQAIIVSSCVAGRSRGTPIQSWILWRELFAASNSCTFLPQRIGGLWDWCFRDTHVVNVGGRGQGKILKTFLWNLLLWQEQNMSLIHYFGVFVIACLKARLKSYQLLHKLYTRVSNVFCKTNKNWGVVECVVVNVFVPRQFAA